MKVIPPIAITSFTSTAAEPGTGETAWVSGNTYALGDVRISTSTHRKYERLIAGAGTITPDLDTTNWIDVGPTNKWAMFDTLRNSATALATGPLTVVIPPGVRVGALALIDLVASAADVSMTVGASTVYSKTIGLQLRHTTTWSQYYFGTFGQQKNAVLFDLPQYAGAVITVSLTNGVNPVQCGALVLGTAVDLGKAFSNPESDSLNFSKFERNALGDVTLIQRRTVPKNDVILSLAKAAVNQVVDVRTSLNAIPAVWVGLPDDATDGYFDTLLIFGIYKQFKIVLGKTRATITLQLEEM